MLLALKRNKEMVSFIILQPINLTVLVVTKKFSKDKLQEICKKQQEESSMLFFALFCFIVLFLFE